ncbi:MAG: hypothetical protein AAF944_10970 [Bacteroidota bacterium]
MLQLLSQSKLIVQILLIAIATLVGVCSSPPARSNEPPKEVVEAKPVKNRTLFEVNFVSSNLQQFKSLAY